MISDLTINEIKRAWRNVYPLDKSGKGIICPLCGNGSGEDGTGVDAINEVPNVLHCFKCGFTGDILRLYAEANHIDIRAEFPRVVSEVAALAGVAIDDGAPIARRATRKSSDKPSVIEKTSAASSVDKKEEPDYTDFYEQANADLCKTSYLAKRGISLATANALNIGYVERWRNPFTKSGKRAPFKAVIIAPTSKSTYLTRDARDGGPGYDSKHNKINVGAVHVFNERALSENATVFVVEGFFDALSLYEAGFKNVVAVNSVSNFNVFARALQDAKPRPKHLILAFDNDKAGAAAFDKFSKVARKFSITAIDGSSLSGNSKDANDLLRAEPAKLKANCQRLVDAALTATPVIAPVVDARFTHVAIAGCPYEFVIPVGWTVNINGISFGSVDASLTPVFPVRKVFHRFLQVTRYVLAYFNGKKWRELTVDAEMIADANKALKLAEHDIQTFAGASKHLVIFFNKFLHANRDRIATIDEHVQPGWFDDFKGFALPGFKGCYAPALEDALSCGGDQKTWIAFARLLCDPNQVKNHIPRIMLALSFAAPLMPILNIRTFMTYIWGTSLAGKTAAVKFALSAWGNPLKLIKTFRATDNGVEGAASRSNNIPLVIDERQVAEAKLDLNKIGYDLAIEQAKTRMTKNGDLRPHKSWRMTVLATGEDKLIDPNTSAGVFNRVLEIPLDADEKVFVPPSGTMVHRLAEQNFGFGARLFLERLMPHHISGFKNVHDTFNEFEAALKDYKGEYSDEHVRMAALVATSFRLLVDYLFELELDTTYITVDIADRNRRLKRLALELAEYIFSKIPKASELDDGRRAFESALGWLRAYRYHFTGDHLLKGGKERSVLDPVYGSFDFNGDGSLDRILILPRFLRAALKKENFPADKCIRDFRARGWIVSDKEGKNPKHHKVRMIEIPGQFANSVLKKNDAESDAESAS